MPKIEIDYSNTIIYKITCNDQRKSQSRHYCVNKSYCRGMLN